MDPTRPADFPWMTSLFPWHVAFRVHASREGLLRAIRQSTQGTGSKTPEASQADLKKDMLVLLILTDTEVLYNNILDTFVSHLPVRLVLHSNVESTYTYEEAEAFLLGSFSVQCWSFLRISSVREIESTS